MTRRSYELLTKWVERAIIIVKDLVMGLDVEIGGPVLEFPLM